MSKNRRWISGANTLEKLDAQISRLEKVDPNSTYLLTLRNKLTHFRRTMLYMDNEWFKGLWLRRTKTAQYPFDAAYSSTRKYA